MFSFLNPWALAALPLAAAPWLLHRWSLSKARTLPFPSLELLKAAMRASFSSSLLSHRLLLFARTLLVLAVVLFMSRPSFRRGSGAPGEAPETLILALDVSASMGARVAGRTRLEWAVSEARAFRPAAGSGSSVGVVAFSDRVELASPPGGDPGRFDEALGSLRVTARPTRVQAGLAAAAALWEGAPPGGRGVLLLTDGAANGWRGAGESFPADARVAVARAPVLASNAAVTDARPAGAGGGAEGRLEAAAWGGSPGARGWTLSWEGRPAAQGRISLDAGPAGAALPRVAPFPFSRGEVSLDPDGMAADDAFFLLPPPESRIGVLVVNGAPALAPTADEAYYLAPVLEGLARAGGRFKVLPLAALASEPLEKWNVLVLANVGGWTSEAGTQVRSFVEKGGGLWVTAGNNFDPAPLLALLPARPTGSILDAGGLAPPSGGRHPLLKRIGGEAGFDWGRVKASRMMEAVPLPGAEVLLAERSGRPLLITGRYGRGRTAFLTTSIDRDWTNLPARPSFPVLCRALWAFLAGADGDAPSSLVVDRAWEGALPGGVADPVVERPDGMIEPPDIRAGRFRYEKTDLPGFYTLRSRADPSPLARAAVNLDRATGESDPTPLSALEVRRLFPGKDVGWIEAPAPVRARYDALFRGRPLARWLAGLAALLFALETLLLAVMKK